MSLAISPSPYRGRLAPSPTGYLHAGHARTFWTAQQRARENGGTLILRNEDLDRSRCKPEFVTGMIEDLKWFGFTWQEGPDCGGPHAPYNQSERYSSYRSALTQLSERGFVYPCTCSRKDIQAAISAPHAGDDELMYPGTCRPASTALAKARMKTLPEQPTRPVSLRFRLPEGETVSFTDGRMGQQAYVSGRDFGDFVLWRPDDVPAYQLACVVDDAAMQITEVVRGEDLLKSTARQLLLYRALGMNPPAFYHCLLMTDDAGVRLAKRHESLSLRQLRAQSIQPETLRASW